MKKIYFLGVFLALGISALAQPTITSNSNPIIGTSIDYINFAWDGNPGASGANQTWDFSTLSGQTATVNYIDPSTAPQGSSFGSANICIDNSGQQYQFYNNSSTGQELLGGYLPSSNGTVIYSNPEKIMEFPCSYQTNWSDSLSGSQSSGITRAGTVTGDGDAYGTLILPNGTYNNVLRVKVVENYEDSFMSIPIATTSNTIYFFYLEGQHSPILALTDANIAGIDTIYGNYMKNIVLKTSKIEEKELSVYPNPVQDVLNLTAPKSVESNYSMEIFNMSGQQLYKTKNPVLSVDMSSYDSGIYLLVIKNGDEMIREKIVKQ